MTVVQVDDGSYRVTAIEETLLRSNLGSLQPGDGVNLERCLRIGDRLDGHMVQGHVDTTAECLGVDERDGSWWFTFRLPERRHLLVQKGSVCINGVSLTVKSLTSGSSVNIEFDVLGKYVERMMAGR